MNKKIASKFEKIAMSVYRKIEAEDPQDLIEAAKLCAYDTDDEKIMLNGKPAMAKVIDLAMAFETERQSGVQKIGGISYTVETAKNIVALVKSDDVILAVKRYDICDPVNKMGDVKYLNERYDSVTVDDIDPEYEAC